MSEKRALRVADLVAGCELGSDLNDGNNPGYYSMDWDEDTGALTLRYEATDEAPCRDTAATFFIAKVCKEEDGDV